MRRLGRSRVMQCGYTEGLPAGAWHWRRHLRVSQPQNHKREGLESSCDPPDRTCEAPRGLRSVSIATDTRKNQKRGAACRPAEAEQRIWEAMGGMRRRARRRPGARCPHPALAATQSRAWRKHVSLADVGRKGRGLCSKAEPRLPCGGNRPGGHRVNKRVTRSLTELQLRNRLCPGQRLSTRGHMTCKGTLSLSEGSVTAS